VADVSRRGAVDRLRGAWDIGSFLSQLGCSVAQMERLLPLGDGEVPIRVVCEAAGVPLVLFPTLSLPGWTTWKRFTDALKPQRPIVNLQLVGNRLAIDDGDATGYSVRSESDASMRALCRAGLVGPFDIVGHSAGGTIALDFALNWPEVVRTLVLIEPGAAWVLRGAGRMHGAIRAFVRDRLGAYATTMTSRRYGNFLKRSYGDPGYDPWKSPFWPLLCAYRNNMKFRAALYTHADDMQRLRCLKCPVLLVRGTESDVFHHAVIDILAEHLCNARIVDLPGGHVPHFGRGMKPFLDVVAAFQGSVDPIGREAAVATVPAAMPVA
jgi:pimeloyl-ACP methyl ester carboxylesterase